MLAKHRDRAKFDLAICVIENARSAPRLAIEKSGCPIYDLNLSRRFYNVVNMVRVVYGFYRVFRATQPHIVQTQALHANLLARLAAKGIGPEVDRVCFWDELGGQELRTVTDQPMLQVTQDTHGWLSYWS